MRLPSLALQLAFLALHRHLAFAAKNITLDDTSPEITYAPAGEWAPSTRNSLDSNGTHATSIDGSATASLTFTGTAIYYLAPLFPYPVSVQITLDGVQVGVVNLTDPNATSAPLGGPASAESSVRWAHSLSNQEHTIVISRGPSGTLVVVDALWYTDSNASSDSGTTTSAGHAPPPTTNTGSGTLSHQGGGSSSTLPIAIGAGVGGVTLIAALGFAVYFLRRRRRHRNEKTDLVLLINEQKVTPFVDPGNPRRLPQIESEDAPLLNRVPTDADGGERLVVPSASSSASASTSASSSSSSSSSAGPSTERFRVAAGATAPRALFAAKSERSVSVSRQEEEEGDVEREGLPAYSESG